MSGAPLRIFTDDALRGLLGRELTCPSRLRVDQSRIDRFADAIDDPQWIHVDVPRARRESPFGTTVAHGFLTLSLLTWFIERTLVFEGGRMGLNYGLDKVRFIRPVPCDTELAARLTLASLQTPDWGRHMTWDVVISDAADAQAGWVKPVLAARWLTRWYR
ncbi:MAG: MaoC family dehydratase [Lautropia sp.]